MKVVAFKICFKTFIRCWLKFMFLLMFLIILSYEKASIIEISFGILTTIFIFDMAFFFFFFMICGYFIAHLVISPH